MPTSEEITNAAAEVDDMDVVETPLKIAKRTLSPRSTTKPYNESHNAGEEDLENPENVTPLQRSTKTPISVSSDSDNEEAQKTLLTDDDGAAAIMKGPKYDVTDVHEKYVLDPISNRIGLIVLQGGQRL